jgi:hypothetical protein
MRANGGRGRGTSNQGLKRRHDGHRQHYDNHRGGGEKAVVDDLVVASMHAAAALTWCASRAAADESIDDSSSDDASEDTSDSDEGEDSSDSDDKSSRNSGGDNALPCGGSDGDSNDPPIDGLEDDKNEVALIDGTFVNNNNDYEAATTVGLTSTSEDEVDGEDDDVSDIDLVEHLSDMEEEEVDDVLHVASEITQKIRGHRSQSNEGNGNNAYDGALRTENEIDPYRCPTEKLEKMNVLGVVGIDELSTAARDVFDTDAHGALIVNEKLKKKLQIAGMVRSFIPGQRTIVVDSFIPTSLFQTSQQCHRLNVVSTPLGEGSMLVVISGQKKGGDGGEIIPITLNEIDDTMMCTVQVLGKIMEIFGPILRPFYAIRLSDPPKVKLVDEGLKAHDRSNHEANSNEDGAASIGEEVDDSNPAFSGYMEEQQVAAANPTDTTATGAVVDVEEDVPSPTDCGNLAQAGELITEETCKMAGTTDDMKSITGEKKNLLQNNSNDVKALEDPWSSDGKLSAMLKSFPSAVVYSIKNNAKLIDTNKVMQISGKGCDASNMYDEELGENEQQYFSDDEQERDAKRDNRKPRQANNEQRGAPTIGGRSDGFGDIGGRGSSRDGRGRGGGRESRGRSHHGSGLYSSRQNFQQQQQQQQYQQHHSFSYLQQPHHNHHWTPLTPGYPYARGHLSYQQGMYQQQQQHQQYQQQYQQQPGSYHGGRLPHHYLPHGQAMEYCVPPPPPPPPILGNAPPQLAAGVFAQYSRVAQPPAPEDDTVYYNYS